MSSNKIPKHVRDKIRQADNDDIYSCYTVGNYYLDNKTLDYDVDKSNFYFNKVSEMLNHADFKVKKIMVQDYKKFSFSTVNISNDFTTVLY